MASPPVSYMTPEEYLEQERLALTKHEYIDGEMVAMAGGSPAHALIIAKLIFALSKRLENSPCETLSADLRICVRYDRLITYPDVTVDCPPFEYVDSKRDTITNPRIVIEVLSPSTTNHDRGHKLALYRLVPSIQEYLLIEQSPVGIEFGKRIGDDHWDVQLISDHAATIRLDSIGFDLPVAEIYKGIEALSGSAART